MWVERDFAALRLDHPSAITIGGFDGVHRGHQALIGGMVAAAEEAGLRPVVVTFDPLPKQFFRRGEALLLSDLDERLERIAALGVAGTVVLRFDAVLAAMPAADFVAHLVEGLRMRLLWTGPDFAVGRGREGDLDFLRAAGQRYGFALHVEPPYRWRGVVVRSTAIRQALRRADLALANELLGRPYRLRGEVVHGLKRGRTLGFPTANLAPPAGRLIPANGLYLCRAWVGETAYTALTNIGTRPTFDHETVTVEAHLLDFDGDLYGRTLTLDFLRYLRPERRFPSVEALIAQINADVALARRLMAGEGENRV